MKHLALTLAVAAASPLTAFADQPPLIDRNLFYGEIAISGAQISPDGRSLSFLKPYKGTRNIWVKGVDEPFSAARPVRAEATSGRSFATARSCAISPRSRRNRASCSIIPETESRAKHAATPEPLLEETASMNEA